MSQEDPRHAAWLAELEAMGEMQARLLDSSSQVAPSDKILFSRAWLAMRAEAKREAREEETLSIAKDANRIASEARAAAEEANRIASKVSDAAKENSTAALEQARWAKWAAIIAAIAAIAANKDNITALFP